MTLCAAAPTPQRANIIVPISKLPPEILEEIFKLCILGMYEPRPCYTPSSSSHALQDHATPREENYYLPWMQVCSAWRIISLSSPRLWCTVDLSLSSRFAEECLRRSKNALIILISSTSEYGPLRLFSDEQDYHNCPLSPSSHLSSLRLNASRIKLIDLFLFPTDMYTLFNTILSSSFFSLPNLTSLTLKLPPLSRPIILPSSITLAHIRHLELEGVTISREHKGWAELHLLRYFSLRGLEEEASPSVEDVRGILERSSRSLEVVKLDDWRPSCVLVDSHLKDVGGDAGYNGNEEKEVTQLLHLKFLTVSSTQNILTSLFSSHLQSRLILNPDARVRLFVSLSEDLHTIFPGGRLPYTHSYDAKVSDNVVCRASSLSPVRLSVPLADQDQDRLATGPDRVGNAQSPSASKGTDIIQTIRLSKNGVHFLTSYASAWITDTQIRADTQSPILFCVSSARPVGTHICSSIPRLLSNKLEWITKLELNTGVLMLSSLITSGGPNNTFNSKHEEGIPEHDLYALFSRLVSLETLCVGFNDLGSLWRVLLRQIPSQSQPILAPRLSNISFGKPSEAWWHFSQLWLGSVVQFVESRCRSVSKPALQEPYCVQPIQAVEFLRCHGITKQCESQEICELSMMVPLVIVQEGVVGKSRF